MQPVMQLIRGSAQWRDTAPVVATIGNFDGMHVGHQAILQRLRTLAEDSSAAEYQAHAKPLTCVISFQPLPQEVLYSDAAPPRLQGMRDRLLSIKSCGIDRCLLLPFNRELRSFSADEFIQSVLLAKMNLHTLVVGDDFRFGHKRGGTFETLKAAGEQHGFAVEDTPTILHQGERISSTRVRHCLQQQDLPAAQALLGRPYRISGRVVHGHKVGRQLGFPTANIALKKQQPPLQGVFAVNATCTATQQSWPAVANLGRRPTVEGLQLLLEVHLLDATEDLYGKHLSIDFLHFIRGETKFASLDDLKAQIKLDADAARNMLVA